MRQQGPREVRHRAQKGSAGGGKAERAWRDDSFSSGTEGLAGGRGVLDPDAGSTAMAAGVAQTSPEGQGSLKNTPGVETPMLEVVTAMLRLRGLDQTSPPHLP